MTESFTLSDMDNPTHRATALDHLAAVAAYSDALRAEWQKDRPDGNEVKFLTASIGRGLKMAEIHATLAIAQALEPRHVEVTTTEVRLTEADIEVLRLARSMR